MARKSILIKVVRVMTVFLKICKSFLNTVFIFVPLFHIRTIRVTLNILSQMILGVKHIYLRFGYTHNDDCLKGKFYDG